MTVELISRMDVLGSALDLIELSADRCSGRVGDREIVAENPRELQSKMSAAVYDILHAGQRSHLTGHPRHLRDRRLEGALSARATHRTTRASGTVCTPAVPAHPVPPGTVLVERDEVRVWVPIAVLDGAGTPLLPGTPVTFTHTAARPALSPGFFVTDGSRGLDRSGPVLRLYVHLLDAAAAPDVWETALGVLEAAGARYRAKILSAPRLYPRRDALVVYLPQPHWHQLPELVERLAGRTGLGDSTSLFTQRLAPGVALAFEPGDPDPARRGLSFGQHRSSVLVHALFAAAGTGAGRREAVTTADLREAVATAFATARIDVAQPFRNTNSPPLPFADRTRKPLMRLQGVHSARARPVRASETPDPRRTP